MKSKPMLIRKLYGERQCRGREIIGLIGTHHGTGVTYTGVMLAFFMSEELGRRTALLECNDHRDMKLLEETYEWSREDSKSFSFHQITCYKEVCPNHIPDIFGEDYQCLILDFGTDFSEYRDEFLRCGTKIIVGGRSEWDIRKLIQFETMTKNFPGNETWLYLIPQADNETASRISRGLSRKVWAVPVCPDPVLPSRSINNFFYRLFC